MLIGFFFIQLVNQMQLGKTNSLYINRQTLHGFYLVDEEDQEVLLPNAFIEDTMKVDDVINVFIYRDSEERLIATTTIPYVEVDQFAYLEVADVNHVGAFLDWGLPKQLFVPHAEQTQKLKKGDHTIVFVYVDEESGRITGSAKENDFVFFDEIDLKIGDQVDLLLFMRSDLGMNAIVNNLYKGLIFRSDIHRDLAEGDRIKGYVKKIRNDGKIDLALQPIGYRNSIEQTAETIYSYLEANGGKSNLTDKSSAEEINKILGMSKNTFKKGVGYLYRNKKIILAPEGIELIQ